MTRKGRSRLQRDFNEQVDASEPDNPRLYSPTLAGRKYRVATEQASAVKNHVQNNVGILRTQPHTGQLTNKTVATPSITHPHQRRMEALGDSPTRQLVFGDVP
jgi:hypothetical protein